MLDTLLFLYLYVQSITIQRGHIPIWGRKSADIDSIHREKPSGLLSKL